MYLTVDLETEGGIVQTERLVDLLKGHVTVYVNGKLLEENRIRLDFLHDCDAQLHGYHHLHMSHMPKTDQQKEVSAAKRNYLEVFDTEPSGWRSPFLNFDRITLQVLHNEEFKWDSSYEQSPITWLRRFQAPLHLFPIHHKWFTGNPHGTTLLHCFEITERVLDTLQTLLEQETAFETHAQAYGKVAH